MGYSCWIGTGSIRLLGDLFSQGPVESNRNQLSSLGRRSLISKAETIRQGLDHFALHVTSSLQGHRGHIGTRSLCQVNKRSFLSRACRVRQGQDYFVSEEISSLQVRQSQIGTRSLFQGGDHFYLGPVESKRDKISSLERRYLFCRATGVRLRLDLFAKGEIFSLQGRQCQIGTRSLHQGEDILSLGPVDSDRYYTFLLGMRSLLSRASKVR